MGSALRAALRRTVSNPTLRRTHANRATSPRCTEQNSCSSTHRKGERMEVILWIIIVICFGSTVADAVQYWKGEHHGR